MVSALNRMLLRDFWRLRGQVIAAMLVMACGVASFVSMRSTYQSLASAQVTYYRAFHFADVFAQLKRAPESLTDQIREIPGVAGVRTRVVMGVTLDVPGLNEPASGRLVSIPSRPQSMLNGLFVRQGRYIEPRRADEVVVSEAFTTANKLQLGDRIGAILNGRWKSLRIVGIALSPEYVYEVGGGSIFPDNKHFGVLWMDRDVLGPAFNMDGAFNDVVLSLAPGATSTEVISRLDLLLARYGSLGAYARDDQLSHRFLSDEIAQNRVSSTYVPIIFLAVAAFLLHIMLSRLVSMQRTEIGLLKAFGYSNRTVGAHYLKLALFMVSGGVLLGSVAGMYFGHQIMAMYREFYHFPSLLYRVDIKLIGAAALIGYGAAGLGAFSAVRRAAALPPAEAMRPESPARFHPGLLERMGLHALLPASVRMILRNLARRPGKALLSVMGISLAVGILVIGGYFLDAIRYLMHVQFDIVQREDVSVWFSEPRSAQVRYDLLHLPGVLRSEPFRAVFVRLRFQHRSRRLQLMGLSSGSFLHRLIDSRLRPVELPPEGMILSTKLAEILGVTPGEVLTVEVLEGARPIRQVAVVGLVDELVGVAAYMDSQALHRLLREAESMSGAYLAVDPQSAARLYTALKQTPAVSTVGVREAILRSFNEILARSLKVTTIVNILFACVIAAGIVYNNARIALSERGNELASLRVLGFTIREVTFILLGEQAILTLAAVPVGFALGFGLCAFLSDRLSAELYRIPFVINGETYFFALVIVFLAATLSGVMVARRIQRLDLIAVLKTRE
jgi:putative ABC transport system permease protein